MDENPEHSSRQFPNPLPQSADIRIQLYNDGEGAEVHLVFATETLLQAELLVSSLTDQIMGGELRILFKGRIPSVNDLSSSPPEK